MLAHLRQDSADIQVNLAGIAYDETLLDRDLFVLFIAFIWQFRLLIISKINAVVF